jgi:DNA-binding SARP family transcriptional activator/tetratricopeptide (TPR) repeat protein
MHEPRTRIRLCGPPAVEIDGRDATAGLPSGQAESLLCYLLANHDRALDRSELIAVVWPDRPPRDPQGALRPILSRLRRALAPATIDGRDRLRLTLPEPVWVDVEQAAHELEQARRLAAAGSWPAVREHARTAAGLLAAGFLPHHEEEWAQERGRQVEELALEALEWTGRGALAAGDLGDAERAGRELVARERYRESGHRLLMEALAAAGNVAEALRVYEDLRSLLRDELGVTPAAEVVALHGRLLAGEGARDRVPLPASLAPRGAFIGRTAELDALRDAWAATGSGRRRFALISGPPGIGKTRLTAELARAAHAGGTVLYGSCPQEPLLSYQPFVEALRHYARNASHAVRPGAGAAELAQLIPELEAGPLPGPAPDDPETRRYLMFEAVSQLLGDACARAPVLLVLDDLHWADRPTLQLLRHVLRAQDEAPLLIAGTQREGEAPAELAELVADLRRDRLLHTVSLAGLDEPGVAALIASQAGHEAPPALARTVRDETDGNPFFVEEVVRHLLESGRWTDTVTPGEIGVPEGVREVLLRRVARLSEPCRSALAHAAVLGREFDFATLRAMLGDDEDAVIAALEEALDARLVVEAPGGYAFTHALVRETLYATLSVPRRQRMHARAAGAIPDSAPTLAALALHHRLAGQAGDPAAAIDCSLRAGARARELFAWEDALAHWDGALAVMERAGVEAAQRAALLVALAELTAVTGDLSSQIAYLERALALYTELRDDERAAQTHSRLGQAHSLIDSIYADHLDIRRAFRHFDAARAVLERGPVRKARGHLETGISTALTYGLEIPRGIEAASRAIEIAEQLGDEALWAGATEAYGWHRIIAGDLREGFDAAERAFASADAGRRPFLAWMATNISGQMAWALGDPDEGRRSFERALTLPYAQDTAYHRETADGIGRCHASRGETEQARRLLTDVRPAWVTHSLEPLLGLWDGNWDAVETLAERVLDTSRRNGNRWDEWASFHLAARVAYLRGDHERAGDLLERALVIVAGGGADYFAMWVLPDLARVRAETGRVEAARAHVERSREIAGRGEDWRGRRGVAMVAEAVVLAAEQRPDEADACFRAAHEILERYGLVGERAECLHEWGRATGAAERLELALELYRAHGAGAAWIERVGGPGRHGKAIPRR